MCSKQSNNPIMNLNETLINLATLLTKLARADDLLGFSKGVYYIERYKDFPGFWVALSKTSDIS